MTSRHEDEVLNQILGSDRKELVSRLPRDTSGTSSSSIGEVSTHDEGEGPRTASIEEPALALAEKESPTPEELHRQALDEKKKYKILKAEGKSEEALKAFKLGKELERQAGALELLLRKNRKKVLSSSNIAEIQKTNDDNTYSGQRNKLSPQKSKEKDDISAELRELGWSDMDLHDADKKPASMSLEGELSTLLGEVSRKTSSVKGSHGIDKTQVIAHKKRALALKREGRLDEAKEELKRAKVLEKKLEEEEFLAEAEDSDDELSALIRSIDSDKQDSLLVSYEPNPGFDFAHLVGVANDLDFDDNFEVTDEDMGDPEITAALKSLGWADEANHVEDIKFQFLPVDREALSSEIQSLKREALNQKRAGNTAEAIELLKKAKVLEKDIDNYATQEVDAVPNNPAKLETGSASQSGDNPTESNKADVRNVNRTEKADSKLAPKSRLMIQKELLGLKKRALALRREGKLDEADEELKRGKVLEQQLEEMDNASKMKATCHSVRNKNDDDIPVPDIVDEEGDVTEQDMHDPTYLAFLKNLGWKEEDDKNVTFSSKPVNQYVRRIDSAVTEAVSSIQVIPSRRSKGEIQKELLGLKRKALALRRQGETEEADEVLKMAKVLEAELAEMEVPKKEAQLESSKHVENEICSSSPHNNAVVGGIKRGVPEEDMQGSALVSELKNSGGKGEVEPAARQEKYSEKIATSSLRPNHLGTKDLGINNKTTHEEREEIILKHTKPQIDEFDSIQATVPENDHSSVRQEILILKRKAVALKREGKLAEAREELRQAKLLEKSLEDSISHPFTSSSNVFSASSNVTSVQQKEHVSSKPLSSRDRFKLQQESLSHKRLALKLRREGRTEEAEAEFELAKSLEAQLEELAANDSVKSSISEAKLDDVGVEDFLDPQLLSALKAIGIEDASASQGSEKPEPVKPVVGKSESSDQERVQLKEQIKAEKLKALNLKRSGKQAEALDALRRAKVLEKKLNSLAS